MAITFDGANKLVITDASTATVDAVYLYSRWKDWLATGTNAKFLPAVAVVGGDPIGTGVSITPYVFLQNGWKVQPQITTAFEITGNLLPETGQSVFAFAPGVRPETVRTLALKSETVATGAPSQPDITAIRNIVEADEVQSAATGKVQKLLRGTSTVILEKSFTGTPLVDLVVVE